MNPWALSGSNACNSSHFPIVFDSKWKSCIHILNLFLVHVCVCFGGGGDTCARVYICMERPEDKRGCPSSWTPSTSFSPRQDLSPVWSSLATLSWLASKPQDLPLSATPTLELEEWAACPAVLLQFWNLGSEDPNSGPHGCKASRDWALFPA